MSFQLTEEQESLRRTVQKFAEKEIAPIAAEAEEKAEFHREIFEKLADIGLLGIACPEEYGGAGLDYSTYIVVVEEIAKHCLATAVGLGVQNLPQIMIDRFGTKEQKEKYLSPLSSGKKLGAFALTEPGAGSDASSLKTSAVRDGDGYVLNGTKVFITHGGVADIYLVMAKTQPEKGAHGISSFIVEDGTPGFSFGKVEKKMGLRASPTREIIFEDCRIPRESLVGKEGDGFKIAMIALDSGRITIGAAAVGVAQAALNEAVKYAKQREQFGQPIASFQGIQFMLADMATSIRAARNLVREAAYLKDSGQAFSHVAAMAKLYATDTAMKVTTDAVQIFGGYGYMQDYPVERLMRAAKVTQIVEGTNQIQRMVIARNLLK
ncbi:MAG: acyl-CoA dehydrogenase [Candidatus Abyssobacteria bacterium SURF_17]|uniref:Cyclohex-1-ene-1-carbonyl-CoA dehydrogenase n=1 Tax=Candidatus Abyssobacteria bacterium SURF_17 TaxID=2093361 RepID=A0A419ERA8_9BACT|nr:MAG: acyl-CoA dehydrogenase [Candidatus Abyssubacteria bacterium SURF_17]